MNCHMSTIENKINIKIKNRHILKVTIIPLFQNHLPIFFWVKFLMAIVHYISQLSTLILEFKIFLEV